MMKIVLLSLLVLCALAAPKFDTPLYKDGNHVNVWKQWKAHFGKTYKNIEAEARAFNIFLDTWKSICKHNDKKLSWTMGINQFTDLTPIEFRMYVHGHNGSCLQKGSKPIKNSDPKEWVNLPSTVNWVTAGKVTPVKNQGQCGSCWAFSATGSTESAGAIGGKGLTSLSEQQLVDCSGSYGNQGCSGGLMDQAFEYIAAVHGLCTESEYPYTAQDGTCQSSSCGTKYDAISGHTDVGHDSTTALMTAIAQQPVSIGVDASGSLWQSYSGGVATASCGDQLDHGVLAAGYGSQSGQDFWQVKNSWGGSWGENGYILLCRNCDKNGGAGECGLMSQPSYPHF